MLYHNRKTDIMDLNQLRSISNEIRCHILKMTSEAQGGHYMSSLSSVEILTLLYWEIMQVYPDNPAHPARDRFILSKGHAAPALYAVLAEKGYFPVEELMTLRRLNGRMQGHPVSHKLPGLDASSGSLGQGLSVGIGMALAARIDELKYRVFILLGDGECQEGQVWEAAMAAAHFRLSNLVAIIDKNNLQISGPTDTVMSLGEISAKWKGFGWNVIEADGHDLKSLREAFQAAAAEQEKPVMIIASTVKGCGVPFIEHNLKYHTAPLSIEELTQAFGCLHSTGKHV
jgi:transketolase